MSERETGGPAFPTTSLVNNGMTLRDYFAGKALEGYWAESGHDVSPEDCAITAQQCYCMADAMLQERAK